MYFVWGGCGNLKNHVNFYVDQIAEQKLVMWLIFRCAKLDAECNDSVFYKVMDKPFVISALINEYSLVKTKLSVSFCTTDLAGYFLLFYKTNPETT
jgi:hypothetical protein